jgi:preprotein translocase subunit SecA
VESQNRAAKAARGEVSPADPKAVTRGGAAKAAAAAKKVGRNEPCPCGSGKKFKKCCG